MGGSPNGALALFHPGTSAGRQPLCLGNAPATRTDWAPALSISVGLVLAFVVSAPYAQVPLREYVAFVPVYNAMVLVLDLITAALLHAQYRQLGERSFFALACGYLLSAVLVVAHGLSFPDAFVPGSAIGNSQTTAWLWMAWHGLFPFFAIAYGWLARRVRRGVQAPVPASPGVQRLVIGATLLLAAGLIALSVYNEGLLPRVMFGHRYAGHTHGVIGVIWAAHLGALAIVIEGTRLRRRIDLWIVVALLALVIDLALSAVMVTARFQLGFYLGRVYGLLANSFVLVALLKATTELYADVARSAATLIELDAELRQANEALEARVQERTAELEAEVRERRALALRMSAVQEEERQRVARDLHDSIGQLAAGLSLVLQAIGASDELREADSKLTQARRLTDEIAREAHSLAACLRPPALEGRGLSVALKQLIERWSAHTGVPAQLESAGLEGARFSLEVETTVYRVVQEALTNVAKHAGATSVSVAVTRWRDRLIAVIEDDGKGFAAEHAPAGRLGLIGMRERAKLVNASLELESSPGAGCTVTLRVPLEPADALVEAATGVS